jgi:hypothetical protein
VGCGRDDGHHANAAQPTGGTDAQKAVEFVEMKLDFPVFTKQVTHHAKQAVSFRNINETCEIAGFASMRNFAKQTVSFAKKLVSFRVSRNTKRNAFI